MSSSRQQSAIGRWLVAFRHSHNWSQKEFSKRSGVNTSVIAMVETGGRLLNKISANKARMLLSTPKEEWGFFRAYLDHENLLPDFPFSLEDLRDFLLSVALSERKIDMEELVWLVEHQSHFRHVLQPQSITVLLQERKRN